MMLEIMLTIIALTGLLIASYTDLKSREVPDWLSYGILSSALGIRLIFSLNGNWNILFSGLFGFGVLFAVGYLFYIVSQWGGGDAKLLMGMGAVIGISLPFSALSLNVLWYFLALLLVGSIYGLAWMFFLMIKSWKEMSKPILTTLKKHHLLHIALSVITIFLFILTFFNKLFWPLVLFPLPLFYLFITINLVEEMNFYRRISPLKLTEGDWLAEEVKANGKVLMEKKTVEKEDILKLRKWIGEKNIKKVLIKDGIPFSPSFLLAYFLFLFGEKIWSIVLNKLF